MSADDSADEPPNDREEQSEDVDELLARHHLTDNEPARRILSRLDLGQEAIRAAVHAYFQDREPEGSEEPVLQSVQAEATKAKIIEAVCRKIRLHALKWKREQLKKTLRWTNHELQTTEAAAASAIEEEASLSQEYLIDPIRMEFLESDPNPYREMLYLAQQVAQFEENKLKTVAEDELLPDAMHRRAKQIEEQSDIDATAFLIELAEGLLTLRPRNRPRAVQAACMEDSPDTPSSQDPPEVVRRLEDIRRQANDGIENIWYP